VAVRLGRGEIVARGEPETTFALKVTVTYGYFGSLLYRAKVDKVDP